jgi:hypothetical protein
MDYKKIKNYINDMKPVAPLLDKKIVAKVTGVTFDGRQDNLALITKDTSIKLERDRRNSYDFYAVKVMGLVGEEWKDLGFLPAKMSSKYSHFLDKNYTLKASIHRISGGPSKREGESDLFYGIEIIIEA